jgi:hypothetical protein
MAVFRAFKPEAMNKIAKAMGYTGNMGQFQEFIEQDPARQARMEQFKNAAVQMAKGGMVKMQTGGSLSQQQIYPQAAVPQQQFQNIDKPVLDDDGNPTGETESVAPNIKDISAQMMQRPGLPTGATTMAAQIQETQGQLVSPTAGTVTGTVAAPTMQAPAQTAVAAAEKNANIVNAAESAPAVDVAMQATEAAQATLDPRAQVTAAQQTASSVGNLQAAQGNAILLNNPVQRQVQAGELISGVANAQTAAQFTEQIQAAEATPSQQATVQGQLAQLTDNFDSANPPA